jgi:hypothetical protein
LPLSYSSFNQNKKVIVDESKGGIPVVVVFFFTVWFVLGLTGLALFHFNKDVKFKKKYFRWYLISAGAIFFTFLLTFGPPVGVVLFFGAALVLITYVNIKNTLFCDSCAKTIYNRMWFSKISYCARCGAKLNEK